MTTEIAVDDVSPMDQAEAEVITAELPAVLEPSTEAAPVSGFEEVKAALKLLEAHLGGKVYDLATKAGEDEAKKDRKQCVALRKRCGELQKELRDPHYKQIDVINDAGNFIVSEISRIEEPIDKQIKAFEEGKKAKAVAQAKAEAERVSGIKRKLDSLNDLANQSILKNRAEDVQASVDKAASFMVDESFAEFTQEAIDLKARILKVLNDRLAGLKEDDARRAEIAREKEQLRVEREQAKKDAEIAAQANAALQQRRNLINNLMSRSTTVDQVDASLEQLSEVDGLGLTKDGRLELSSLVDGAVTWLSQRRVEIERHAATELAAAAAAAKVNSDLAQLGPMAEAKPASKGVGLLPVGKRESYRGAEPGRAMPLAMTGADDMGFVPADGNVSPLITAAADLPRNDGASAGLTEEATAVEAPEADDDFDFEPLPSKSEPVDEAAPDRSTLRPTIPAALFMVWLLNKAEWAGAAFTGAINAIGFFAFEVQDEAIAYASNLTSHGNECLVVRVK